MLKRYTFEVPLIFCMMALATLAQAQSYPVRPIRMIIPFSPAGATDTPGRILARKMSDTLGQQVVVENHAGAGATIGTNLAALAPGDGYTLLFTATPHVLNPHLYKNLPFDAIGSFAPIMRVGSAPMVLAVHPSVPAKTVKELVQLTRSKPDKLDFGSSGSGSAQHLFGALFMSSAGIKLTHIPYRGSAQSMTALIGGEVSVGVAGIPTALSYARNGRLRVLAVTSAKRSSQLPQVPTMDEAGVKNFDATLWLGLLAPKGTPREIISKLNIEVTNVLKSPEIQQSFLAAGTEVVHDTPDQFSRYLKVELDKWGKVIQEIGAKVE